MVGVLMFYLLLCFITIFYLLSNVEMVLCWYAPYINFVPNTISPSHIKKSNTYQFFIYIYKMFDFGYLKTTPGLLTVISSILNLMSAICVVTSEANDSIHGGFLTAVTALGFIICIFVILFHISTMLANKIQPYPFAIFQVIVVRKC